MRDGQEAVDKAVHAAAGILVEMGRRIQPISGSQGADERDRPAGGAAHFHDPVRALRKLQISRHDRVGRGDDRTGGRADRAKLTHTPFSVSSVLGLLALLGVSVETAVILVSYINKLRQEGMDIRDSYARGVAACGCAPS